MQPFPTKPPPFATQSFTEDHLISLTPALRAEAIELTRAYRFGNLFTPPSIEGTLAMPGIIGGGNWGGAAVDPTTGYLFVKSTEEPSLLRIAPANPENTVADYAIDRTSSRTLRVRGLPISDPPYGTLTGINMNTGEIVWQEPVGDRADVREHPELVGVELPARLGVTGAAGPVATAGGLVFLTGGGDVLYAFDSATGAELWSAPLPGRGYANPMSYATSDARQFIVIAAGGGSTAGTLLAYALPR